jgi:hypothetical protein
LTPAHSEQLIIQDQKISPPLSSHALLERSTDFQHVWFVLVHRFPSAGGYPETGYISAFKVDFSESILSGRQFYAFSGIVKLLCIAKLVLKNELLDVFALQL